jgi:CRISPR/Cas system CSM-associated protein Csm2 small subunit
MKNERREQAEYHLGFSWLERLNRLFYLCNDSALSLDSMSWYHALRALYRELSTEMKPDEEKEIKNALQCVAKKVYHPSQARRGISAELYEELEEIEKKLREIMKEAGLQMKFAEDPTMALK